VYSAAPENSIMMGLRKVSSDDVSQYQRDVNHPTPLIATTGYLSVVKSTLNLQFGLGRPHLLVTQQDWRRKWCARHHHSHHHPQSLPRRPLHLGPTLLATIEKDPCSKRHFRATSETSIADSSLHCVPRCFYLLCWSREDWFTNQSIETPAFEAVRRNRPAKRARLRPRVVSLCQPILRLKEVSRRQTSPRRSHLCRTPRLSLRRLAWTIQAAQCLALKI
jgi:hypothetical protein